MSTLTPFSWFPWHGKRGINSRSEGKFLNSRTDPFSQLTDEKIQEFLDSPDGQQLVAEVLEALATGDAEFEVIVEVNGEDDTIDYELSFGDDDE